MVEIIVDNKSKIHVNLETDISQFTKIHRHKTSQKILLKFYDMFNQKKYERAENCARIIGLEEQYNITNPENETRLKITDIKTCQLSFCSVCSWRRAMKYTAIVYETIREHLENNDIRFIFLTLTVKNPKLENLNETVKHMQKSFNYMTRSNRWKNSILGYARTFEITKPDKSKQKDNIHPHFHTLLAVKPSYFATNENLYINTKEFSKMWQNALKCDYEPVCDIRVIKPNKNKSAVLASLCELIKYPLKGTDLKKFTWQEFQILEQQMARVRKINFGGIFKQGNSIKLDDAKPIELTKAILTQENISLSQIEENDEKQWELIHKFYYRYSYKQSKYNLLFEV